MKTKNENFQYYLVFKPYKVLSQFTSEEGKLSLKDVFEAKGIVPDKDSYPVGRLDYDSEGLIIITNDKNLHYKLLDPKFEHKRRYLVQVENIPSDEQLDKLKKGVEIAVKDGKYTTKPTIVKIIKQNLKVPERVPPIRVRETIPTTWIQLELKEGKNRQVRKMTAAIGLPTLRLVRISIEALECKDYEVGEIRIMSKSEIYPLLGIEERKAPEKLPRILIETGKAPKSIKKSKKQQAEELKAKPKREKSEIRKVKDKITKMKTKAMKESRNNRLKRLKK